MPRTRVSSESNYASVSRIVSSMQQSYVVLPASYKDNEKLLSSLHYSNISAPANSNTENTSDSGKQPSNSDFNTEETSICYIPNGEFNRNKAMQLIALISLLGMPEALSQDDRIAFLGHLIGDDECILRAIGGLLFFIIQNGALASISNEDNIIHFNAIRHPNYCDVMRINPTTLQALHVFNHDTHPVGHGSMRAKEGLSLFGVIKSHVKTAAARVLLKTWLHYPSTSIDCIRQRQVLIQNMRGNSNQSLTVTLKNALKGVKNVSGILGRLRRISGSITDWKGLYSSAKSYIIILEALKVAVLQREGLLSSSIISKASAINEAHLQHVVSWIDAIVDFEESTVSGKMVVANGFSEEIDEMKRNYSALDDFLTTVGVEELEKLVSGEDGLRLEFLEATYQPQIGYLVVLSEHECELIGLGKLEERDLSFIFSSNDERYHFKNTRCRELDEELGDIHGSIADLEAKAFRYLESKIFECSETLYEVSLIVTELDCMQALASSANEYSWVTPVVSEEACGLEIEQGRHALVELTVPCFVPNSTRMKVGDVHVLTGYGT